MTQSNVTEGILHAKGEMFVVAGFLLQHLIKSIWYVIKEATV